LVLWTATGCPAQPTVVPSRNLDRPTDMTFGCMGLFKENGADRISGRPMAECHPPGVADPSSDSAHRTFGFVANTARGEMSVIDLDKSHLVDLDPGIIGFNTVPLGVLPEAMAISDDGCRVVTANRGSCDLSVVDPGELMLPTLAVEAKDQANLMSSPLGVVATIKVKGISATGQPTELKVAPYEVQFLPRDIAALTGDQMFPPGDGGFVLAGGAGGMPSLTLPVARHDHGGLCPAGASAPSATPLTWRALVTFPSCDLVAMVDIPSGNIIDSVFVRAAGDGKNVLLEPGGANPSCPFVDCGMGPRRMPVPASPDAGTDANASTDAAPDGAVHVSAEAGAEAGAEAPTDVAVDGGAAETVVVADGGDPDAGPPPVRVMDEPFIGQGPLGVAPLAIHPDGTRAYVGLANASFVAVIKVTGTKLGAPPTGASIYLHEGALGSDRIRLSVDPYSPYKAQSGLFGKFVGEGDGSRRYLYVIARDGTVRVIHVAEAFRPESECDTNIDPRLLVPADEQLASCFPIDPARRKVLAAGPGISLPALPRDLAFVDLKLGDPNELAVDGAFGFILTATGTAYMVNIDPTPRKTKGVVNGVVQDVPEPPPLVNTLRDANVISYSRALTATAGPARVDILPVAPPSGPRLEGFFALDSVDNATALGAAVPTFVFFPDRSVVSTQTWAITWEGPLFPDPRYSAKVTKVDPVSGAPVLESVIRDRGGAFCKLGVMPGDVLTLEGCADNSQCGIGQVCVVSAAAGRTSGGLPIKGLCLSPLAVEQERQKAMCRRLQESIRRYEVVKVHPTELVVRPRVDELVKTPLNPDLCSKEKETKECAPGSDPAHKGFTCVGGRCVKTCVKDEDCRTGRKCVDFGGDPKQLLCADGPEVADGCFDQLTAYRVSAGRSFLVRGSAAAVPNTTLTVPDPEPGRFKYPNPDPQICVEDPARNSVLATRIPMNSAPCKNIKGVETLDSRAPPDSPVNARLLQEIARTTPDPNPCLYLGGPTEGDPAVTATSPARTHVRALFQNAELRFILSNLEQPFAEATEMRFDVHGGFRPHSVVIPPDTIDIGMPARLLVSPLSAVDGFTAGNTLHELPYLFVVDQRRLGRTRGSTATRGQVLRIHPTGSVMLQRQPIYQDFTASGGVYPIQ
jgi:hypothetical protein